jgi:O-antigen/teichoic acid export membrane protein
MVLFVILIARRLGQDGFGEYAFVASAVMLANTLSTFGTDMLLVRDIAAGGGLARLRPALVLQLALSAVLVLIALAGAAAIPNQSQDATVALRIYSFALLPLAIYGVLTAALRGLGYMDRYAVLNLAASAVQLALAWLVVPAGGSVVSVALALLGAQLVATALAAALCARVPGLADGLLGSARVRPLLLESAPIALLGALGMLYQRSAVLLLASLTGPAATGIFSAAARAVEGAKTMHLAAFGALYPALAESAAEPSAASAWRATFVRSASSLLVLALVVAAVLAAFADPIVGLLFGPGFEAAAGALRVLAWILIPYTASAFLSLALMAAHRERAVARGLAAGLVVLVVLCVWLIPSLGLVGACWASLAAETAQASVLIAQWRSGRIVRTTSRVAARA